MVSPTRRVAARVGCRRGLEVQDTPGLHAVLGSLLLDEGDTDEADWHFRALADHFGPLGQARLQSLLGRLQLEAAPKQATASFETALALDPSLLEALEGLRDGYAALGQRQQLRAVVPRLLAATADPTLRATTLTDLGRLWHRRLGDPYQAADCFEQALLYRPDAPEPLFGLAESHAARGEYQASLRCLEATAQLAAAQDDLELEITAHLRAGELWEEMGDLDSAAARFHRAVRIDPLSARALEQAAEADVALGRTDLAADGFGRLAAIAADRDDRSLWLRALEQLTDLHLDQLQAPGPALAAIERYLGRYPDDEQGQRLSRRTRAAAPALPLPQTPPTPRPRPAAPEPKDFTPTPAPPAPAINERARAAPPDLSSALTRATDYEVPAPAPRPILDTDLDGLIQAHLRAPDDKELAQEVVDRLERAEDWDRLAALLAGQAEGLDDLDHKREVLLRLAEVMINGLEDPESGAECLLRAAEISDRDEGARQARRAAELFNKEGLAEAAAEAQELARRLAMDGER